ncbi:metal ABC transporter permease [Canibacter sp. lx-45]|uniref:metal ABC transporter permease n=1 Tax=Canibacter zhuwentaonis TaxID=2837491 RepID=UPI001BDC67B6|nr:metal ABC transporter permease [Canibacter zhuwentaonis]MBT1035772.1 metal ABC transporter permease [Canibacter zhuwentaonis]
MSYLVLAGIELTMLSLLSGIVGTIAVFRQRAFFSVALSHATFPGGVIAALIGANVLLGQAIAGAIFAVLLALLSRVKNQGQGTATGILLVFGFALGALLTSLQKGFTVPVDALLIGSVFGVQKTDLIATLLVLLCAIITVLCYGRQLLYDTFDSPAARAAGYSPLRAEIITTVLVALTTTVALPAVGAILTTAIVIAPAASAILLTRDIRFIAPLAILFGLLGSAAGLFLSVKYGFAAGGTIGLSLAAIFFCAWLWRLIRNKNTLTRHANALS